MSTCSRRIKHAAWVILRAHFATELTQNSNPLPGSILSLTKWEPKTGNRPLSGKKSSLILRQLSASDERQAERWRVYTESGFRLLHVETFVPLTAVFICSPNQTSGWMTHWVDMSLRLVRPTGTCVQFDFKNSLKSLKNRKRQWYLPGAVQNVLSLLRFAVCFRRHLINIENAHKGRTLFPLISSRKNYFWGRDLGEDLGGIFSRWKLHRHVFSLYSAACLLSLVLLPAI